MRHGEYEAVKRTQVNEMFSIRANPCSSVAVSLRGLELCRRIVLFFIALFSTTSLCAQGPLEDVVSSAFRLAEQDRSGTGFLVSTKAADSGADGIVLVTAAHVFEQMGDSCDWI